MRSIKQVFSAFLIGCVTLFAAQASVADRYYDRHDRDHSGAVGAAVVLGIAALIATSHNDRGHYYRDRGYTYGYRDRGYRGYNYGYRDRGYGYRDHGRRDRGYRDHNYRGRGHDYRRDGNRYRDNRRGW